MPQQKTKHGFNHAEAFCLMWYSCPCGHRERFWNSRDGVTPFGGIPCPSCGGKGLAPRGLSHTNFSQDEFAPGYELQDGQQFFRDGTAEEAVAIIERRIARFRESGAAVPQSVADRLIKDARLQVGEWIKGWPMVERYKGAADGHQH